MMTPAWVPRGFKSNTGHDPGRHARHLYMRRRALIILLVVVGVAAAITAAVLLRKAAPPEAVRLLPPADGFVYINFKSLRRAHVFESLPAVQFDPEYDHFVQQTGFRWEQDLDEAALAMHFAPKAQASATGELQNGTRFSEVFSAHFDAAKLQAYLKTLAHNVDQYRQVDIYSIPLPGRTLRIAVLGPELVAASNTEGPYVIQGIIDRSRELAYPFRGPELVRSYYRDIPFLSLAWLIAKPPASPQGNSVLSLPGGYQVFFPPQTTMLGSIRYAGGAQLRLAAYAAGSSEAQRISDQLSAFLALFRTIESSAAGNDPDVKAFFESVKVEQKKNEVELTASVPQGFLKKVVSETPSSPQPAAPPPEPKKPAKPSRKHK